MGRNHLSEIPRDAIVSLKNLNQLDLSENKIEHIKPGVFQGRKNKDKEFGGTKLIIRVFSFLYF